MDKRLKNFATKQDIGKLPTKAYVDNRIFGVRKEVWEVKDRLEKVEVRLKFLPTKTDFVETVEQKLGIRLAA